MTSISSTNLVSPTVEALCQDLDTFITELSLNEQETMNTWDQSDKANTTTNGYSAQDLSDHSQDSCCSPKAKQDACSPPTSPQVILVVDKKEESLSRAASSSSGKSITQLSVGGVPASPKMYLNPVSPLSFQPVHESIQEQPPFEYALLSQIAESFAQQVTLLNDSRRIFCTAEYPLSFNGEEAMEIMRSLLPTGLSDRLYLDVLRSMMRCDPPLIIPIAYSEKSIRKNKFYNSPTEIYTLVESQLEETPIIQGVYTNLTCCYSISCAPGLGGCYSPLCPNKLAITAEKSMAKSMGSSASHETTLSRAWSANVAKDILLSMPPDEIKRQEAIHELIYTEDDYVRDLKLLDQIYAQELIHAQCIEESRRESFCENLFNNYKDILDIHWNLLNDLKEHQFYCQAVSTIGIVDQVGHIFLKHLPRFMDTYLQYTPHVVLAEYASKKEFDTNIVFQNFIRTQEKLAECRKLPFRHFLILPVTRLQRYVLLLDAVLKKTASDHPDKEKLAKAIDIIKTVAAKADEKTLISKNTLRVLEISDRIRFKAGEYHSLDLLEPGRKLIMESALTRKSQLNVETVELQVFLFDHMLIMTKPKIPANSSLDIEYYVSKKPIPIQFLQVQDYNESFSIGLKARRGNTSTLNNTHSSNQFVPGSTPPTPGGNFPLVFQYLGRNGADYVVSADSAATRTSWKEKINQAKDAFEKTQSDKHVFDIQTLSDTTFALAGTQNNGLVTCSVPFKGPNDIGMVAIGTQQGVWVGLEGKPLSFSLVLSVVDVTSIGVLEDHNIFLILADKTLNAYSLDNLIIKRSGKSGNDKHCQKVANHVNYFQTGVCNGRTHIIIMKRRGVDSLFKVFEPVCGDLRNPKNSKFLGKSGLFGKVPSWFKSYSEFYVGTDSYAVHFLKARVVIVCARGFEIINLDDLSSNRNLPDLEHSDFNFVKQLGEELRPLGMFRCEQNYLLCYNDFVFKVNMHGQYVRESPMISWEGEPQAVAFQYPYVIGFDSRFIEVRHVNTGELVQILTGYSMRCLEFVHNTTPPIIHGCMAHPFKPNYQYIFQLQGIFST